MKRFLLSKAGLSTVCIVTVVMAIMLHRVTTRARQRENGENQQTLTLQGREDIRKTTASAGKIRPASEESIHTPDRVSRLENSANGRVNEKESKGDASEVKTQENLSYLDRSRLLGNQSKKDRDRQGRVQTRRKTAGGVGEAQNVDQENAPAKKKGGLHLRLEGHGVGAARTRSAGGSGARSEITEEGTQEMPSLAHAQAEQAPLTITESTDKSIQSNGSQITKKTDGNTLSGLAGLTTEEQECFCPYGRPIKCELVFTIDSCMEETPVVALVMEPVYNNGQLVIPAGAELHGMARPDRLRDRIFSANEWVLLFPRDKGLANGRELRVRGLALDRAEPASDGLSWGLTDGSNGLQGQVIRTLENEEIKRFAATFITASALGLQERESSGKNGNHYTNSPSNAALQGVAATLEDAAKKIGAEIERHGVFLRVPGGKQFYFYPQQAIHPRMAMLPVPTNRAAGGN